MNMALLSTPMIGSLCDLLGFASVIFVGHSVGAAIDLYFCALFLRGIERFVLVDAGNSRESKVPAGPMFPLIHSETLK